MIYIVFSPSILTSSYSLTYPYTYTECIWSNRLVVIVCIFAVLLHLVIGRIPSTSPFQEPELTSVCLHSLPPFLKYPAFENKKRCNWKMNSISQAGMDMALHINYRTALRR